MTKSPDHQPSLHELDAPPWLRFEATLMATSRDIRRAYDIRMAHLQLNLSEACLLAYVNEHGPVTQTHVAARIGMSRASAGLMVDALDQRGLLTRTADPQDRRVWHLVTTSEGHRLAGEVTTIDAAFRAQLRVGLSRSERQHLASLLVAVQRNLAVVLAEHH
ncbi:MAG: MarR family winged helix-turn-helix transcriptional regulator [Actinomycetota bacterium]